MTAHLRCHGEEAVPMLLAGVLVEHRLAFWRMPQLLKT
jgi:hypothetical protein